MSRPFVCTLVLLMPLLLLLSLPLALPVATASVPLPAPVGLAAASTVDDSSAIESAWKEEAEALPAFSERWRADGPAPATTSIPPAGPPVPPGVAELDQADALEDAAQPQPISPPEPPGVARLDQEQGSLPPQARVTDSKGKGQDETPTVTDPSKPLPVPMPEPAPVADADGADEGIEPDPAVPGPRDPEGDEGTPPSVPGDAAAEGGGGPSGGKSGDISEWQQQQSFSPSGSHALSTRAIVLIALGSTGVLLCVLFVCVARWQGRRRRQWEEEEVAEAAARAEALRRRESRLSASEREQQRRKRHEAEMAAWRKSEGVSRSDVDEAERRMKKQTFARMISGAGGRRIRSSVAHGPLTEQEAEVKRRELGLQPKPVPVGLKGKGKKRGAIESSKKEASKHEGDLDSDRSENPTALKGTNSSARRVDPPVPSASPPPPPSSSVGEGSGHIGINSNHGRTPPSQSLVRTVNLPSLSSPMMPLGVRPRLLSEGEEQQEQLDSSTPPSPSPTPLLLPLSSAGARAPRVAAPAVPPKPSASQWSPLVDPRGAGRRPVHVPSQAMAASNDAAARLSGEGAEERSSPDGTALQRELPIQR